MTKHIRFEQMSEYDKGLYTGMTYILLMNNKGRGTRQYVTGVSYRDALPQETELGHDIKEGDFIVPVEGSDGWQEWAKFDPEKFKAAFFYLYSGDEPGVENRYQLYAEHGQYDTELKIEIQCSEEDKGIASKFGRSIKIIHEEVKS